MSQRIKTTPFVNHRDRARFYGLLAIRLNARPGELLVAAAAGVAKAWRDASPSDDPDRRDPVLEALGSIANETDKSLLELLDTVFHPMTVDEAVVLDALRNCNSERMAQGLHALSRLLLDASVSHGASSRSNG